MGLLDTLNQDHDMERDEYKSRLHDLQLAMLELQQELLGTRRTLILAFEGPDAGGKGGAIKRVIEMLDPHKIKLHAITKPTQTEYRYHYLWRFWNKLPAQGETAIFDRSWYGRVLVERVEGFATKHEWKRAYEELNEFERVLIDDGSILLKFYIHITKEEQKHRFERRQKDPFKRWKINDEDWRNRDKWNQHIDAAEDMFKLTSSPQAPWHVVAGNYKWYARTKVLRTVVEKLKKELNHGGKVVRSAVAA
ncbi:MAG: UDP-galactose-lipid carrier transferase [Verrucomicrobiota bacterium]